MSQTPWLKLLYQNKRKEAIKFNVDTAADNENYWGPKTRFLETNFW